MALDFRVDSATYLLSLKAAPVSTVPLTLACWFKYPAASAATVESNILSMYQLANGDYFRISIDPFQGKAYAETWNAQSVDLAQASDVSWPYNDFGWHHLCATFTTGTNNIKLYVDGTVCANLATIVTLPGTCDCVFVGANDTTAEPVDAIIAECAAWNVVLTATQIAQLAKRINPTTIRPDALKAYWPLHKPGAAAANSYDVPNHWANSGGDATFHFNLSCSETNPAVAPHPPVQPMRSAFRRGWRGISQTPAALSALTSLKVSSPTVGSGTAGFVNTLSANNLSVTGALGFGVAYMGSAPVSITVGSPFIFPGSFAQKHLLPSVGFVQAHPVIDLAAMNQALQLLAGSLKVAPPSFSGNIFYQGPRNFTAPSISVAAPTMTLPSMTIRRDLLVFPPDYVKVGSPSFSLPQTTRVYNLQAASMKSSKPVLAFQPVPAGESAFFAFPTDPYVSHRMPADGIPETLFSGYNDAHDLWLNPFCIVGRTDPKRGVAQKLIPKPPLRLGDRTIEIDWTDVQGLRSDVNSLLAMVTASTTVVLDLAQQVANLTAQVAGIQAQITEMKAQSNANVASIRALQNRTGGLSPQAPIIGAPAMNKPPEVKVASPVIGVPIMTHT